MASWARFAGVPRVLQEVLRSVGLAPLDDLVSAQLSKRTCGVMVTDAFPSPCSQRMSAYNGVTTTPLEARIRTVMELAVLLGMAWERIWASVGVHAFAVPVVEVYLDTQFATNRAIIDIK